MGYMSELKRTTIEHCESYNEDGTLLISWPCKLNSNGYILTKYTNAAKTELVLEGAYNTKYVDKTELETGIKVKFKVECYRVITKGDSIDKEGLCGSLEKATLKGNTNTAISDYILANYDALMEFVEKLPHIDKALAASLLNDVWLKWSKKEQQGYGYSASRIGKNGTTMTVEQVVETSLKSYAKNSKYTMKYNNKHKVNGIEVEIHSVSMLEEREEGSDNNFIVARASLKRMSEMDSPLDDLVEICTLKEDLEYVINATKDYKISARNILDNFSTLLEVVSDNVETGCSIGEATLRNMNKTLFSEYTEDLSMMGVFSRIFSFMNKDMALFTEIYESLVV